MKRYFRGLVAMLCALVLVFSLIVIPVGAADVTVPAANRVNYNMSDGTKLTFTKVENSSGNTLGDAATSGSNVILKINGASGSCGDSSQQAKFTVSKPFASELYFKAAFVNGGTYNVYEADGTVATVIDDASSPYNGYYHLSQEGSYFVIDSIEDSSKYSTLTLSDFHLENAATYFIKVCPGVGGKVVAHKTASFSQTVNHQEGDAATAIAVAVDGTLPVEAVPNDGYAFFGFVDGDAAEETYLALGNPIYNCEPSVYQVDVNSDGEYTEDEAKTVKAVFTPVSSSSQPFLVGNSTSTTDYTLCNSFADAVDYATTNNKSYIIPLSDMTIPAGEYTIPSGCTLLIPDDGTYRKNTTAPRVLDGNSLTTTSTENHFIKLTLENGTIINVADGGAICVNAVLAATCPNVPSYGPVVGEYGHLQLDAGSEIHLKGSSNLYAWGFVTGDGNIYAEDTSKVYEHMLIMDWCGGSAASTYSSTDHFPFNQYYVQNVECNLTINYQSKEYVYIAIFIPTRGYYEDCLTEFVGQNGMFILDEGSTLTKYYDPVEDKCHYIINGDSTLGKMTVSVSGAGTFDSTAFYLPINNIDIDIESGTFSTDNNVIFLPGSSVNVEDGATVEIKEGATVVFADKADIVGYSTPGNKASNPYIPAAFTPSRIPTAKSATTATWNSIDSATIDNNGTVIVDEGANFTTTASGADLTSESGTGTYIINGTTTPPTFTLNSTNSKVTAETAVLQNADGSELSTSERWFNGAQGVYRMKEVDGVSVWGDFRDVTYYDRNGTQIGEVATGMAVGDKEDVEPGYTSQIEASYSDNGRQYEFGYWNYTVNESDATKINANPYYYGVYTITWNDYNGTLLQQKTYHNTEKPVYDGADVTRADSTYFTFTRIGWSDGTNTYALTDELPAVADDTVYTAVYQYNSKWSEPEWTWTNSDDLRSLDVSVKFTSVADSTVTWEPEVTVTKDIDPDIDASIETEGTYTASICFHDETHPEDASLDFSYSKSTPVSKSYSDDETSGQRTYSLSYNSLVTAVSHTANVGDDGVQNGNYADNQNGVIDVISIPGAEKLHVYLRYGSEGASWDWVSVWQGAHANYKPGNSTQLKLALKFDDGGYGSSGKFGGHSYEDQNIYEIEFDVDGEAVTFGYKSDSSGQGVGYGYYAVVTGLGATTVTYNPSYTVSWDIDGDGTADSTQSDVGNYTWYSKLTLPTLPENVKTKPISESEEYYFMGWNYSVADQLFYAGLEGLPTTGIIHTDINGSPFDNEDIRITGNTTLTPVYGTRSIGFYKHSVAVTDSIDTKFYINLPDGHNPDNCGVDFSWGNNVDDGNNPFTFNSELKPVVLNGETFYVAHVPVAAKEMSDEITAILKDNGVEIARETYKASDYMYNVINMDRDELAEVVYHQGGHTGYVPADQLATYREKADQLKELCKAMLTYGAEAQKNFGYHTNSLADEDLNGYTYNEISSSDLLSFSKSESNYSPLTQADLNSDGAVDYYGLSLTLKSNTIYNILFWNRTGMPLSATAVSGDETYVVTRTVVNGNNTASSDGIGDYVRFDITGIPAAKLTEDITLTFADRSGFTVNPATYMYEALYTYETYHSSYPQLGLDKLAGVVKALYNYNQAAVRYFS